MVFKVELNLPVNPDADVFMTREITLPFPPYTGLLIDFLTPDKSNVFSAVRIGMKNVSGKEVGVEWNAALSKFICEVEGWRPTNCNELVRIDKLKELGWSLCAK